MDTPLAFRAMNTDFLVAGVSASSAAAVREQVELAETTFSRFKPDSEISRINRSSGAWVPVSILTYEVLEDAMSAFASTEGLFSPFLGRVMQAAGYDRSFEELLPVQLQAEDCFHPITAASLALKNKLSEVLSAPMEMDATGQRVRLSPGVELDLGGIAKGWTAQRAADGLIAAGVSGGLIDAGGDVVVWGREPEQGVWGIGVGHPFGGTEDIADLWLEGLTAVATSSIVKRRWQRPGGESVHHIIDPRTGKPAGSDLLQATVLSHDLTIAEQYAKCLLVLGSGEGISWLEKACPNLACILVRRDGAVLSGGNLEQYSKKMELHHHADI